MAEDRDARIDRLLELEDIRACLTRFSRAMDRFDRELFLSAFHDDAVIAAGPFVGSAADCYDWAVPMHEEGQYATQHCLLNQTIDIDGDTAHAETYYQFIGRNRDESNWMAGGRYLDRLEKRDGAWRIAMRMNIIEWSGMLPTLPVPFGDLPDIGLNGLPARDRSDPSYRRPLENRREPQIPATPDEA
ncbi:nuclear transport factor 2 family protein [Stakelama tenebrarum]|uniref:Nuclear transport factor 2 family protein n=1 Tax=Stakelama tenebrarum TaxID=2711215 RepID=A0A6G6Y8A8_9SPHN|nr:nuclear transport factor 2 family protein [Sphingosinithalassobacter tenebrarum]QIG80806.1 nuclear transport factor 2 family protein [Sphingosinithalassobacter tenebrarum]